MRFLPGASEICKPCSLMSIYTCYAAHYVHFDAAFAAARAYDRALLTNRRPSEQSNNFNFPVQDYVAAENSDLSKAAMVQLHAFQSKPSSKRPRPSSIQATHQSPPSKRRPSKTTHAQPRCAVDPPVGHTHAVPSLPVKRSWKRQPLTDQDRHHRPVPAAGKPGQGADWHHMHHIPSHTEDHAHGQLHKQAQVESRSWQAETGRTAPIDDADMAQRSGVDSDQRVHDKEPSTSGNHCSQNSVVSGASLAISTQHTNYGFPPEAEPPVKLDAGKAGAFKTDLAQTGAACSTAPDDAASHHKEPHRATMSYKERLDTARQQEHPSLHPVVCHAHRQACASPPRAVPERFQFPNVPACPTQPQADGPAARHPADAALPDKSAETIPAPTPHLDGHNQPSGSNAGQKASKPTSSILSPEPETVRAGDSDDDVEIMDDSPVHKPVSSDTLFRQGMPPNTDNCSQQQARKKVPHWDSAEGDLPPWHQEQQLPVQQLSGRQGQTWQQQQQQPGKRPQEPQQQEQFFQQEAQLSRQQKAQQQPHQQHDQAGRSSNLPDLSGQSRLAKQVLTTAGREWLPPPAGTAVKQEPPASQSRDSAHGYPSQEALPGSSLTHPLELSESDADSSASSSVDPSQRVPAPWLHTDTAASRQQEHGDCVTARGAVPAGSGSAQAANCALLTQASQGSTFTHGHLRTKR